MVIGSSPIRPPLAGTHTYDSTAIDGGTLNVDGALETSTVALGDNTTITVDDNTVITGTIDGGDGLDTRVYNIDSNADLGALVNFEGLTKTGAGVLSIQGPGSSTLDEVEVLGGTLNIANTGGIVGVTSATVGAGATLNVDGAFEFTAGGDTFNVAGTVTAQRPSTCWTVTISSRFPTEQT